MDGRDDADLDEGALMMMYPEDGDWKVIVISGASNGENYEES